MLGTVTASIDLVNDVTQAPIDNTTMIMDLVGVGAGLFGGRGIENGTSESLKLTKYINTSNVQDFISRLTAKAKPAFAGFSEEQLAKESGTMVRARDEYRLASSIKHNGLNEPISVQSINYNIQYGIKYDDNGISFVLNKQHNKSLPTPKGLGPNGGRMQSHHILQNEWAEHNLNNYNKNLAPTITIETGKNLPHTKITNSQNLRREC